MPCLNEALTIGTCIQKARGCIARLGLRAEVVVADNGSTDGSPADRRERGRSSRSCARAWLRGRAVSRREARSRPLHHHGRRRRQLRLQPARSVRRAAARRRGSRDGQPLSRRDRAGSDALEEQAHRQPGALRHRPPVLQVSGAGLPLRVARILARSLRAHGPPDDGDGVRVRDGHQGHSAGHANRRSADDAVEGRPGSSAASEAVA